MNDTLTKLMDDLPRGDPKREKWQFQIPDARWMAVEKMLASEALRFDPRNPGDKVLIGALGDQLIGISDDRHILTVAGSRAGKSVGLISNLFFYAGSVLATDPKGELAQKTARRREAMGQTVYVLDPFLNAGEEVARYRASYNPLSVLTEGSLTFLEDAALIAEAIVVQSSDTKDPHWDESAKHFIEGVIVHVATDPLYTECRNLITVRELIKRAMLFTTDENGQKSSEPYLFQEMKRNAARLEAKPETEVIGSALMGAATEFYEKPENERASVRSTVNRQTQFLDYAAFRNVLQEHSFDLADLKRNPKGVSVYLCFPATRIEIAKRWMRIFINQLLDAMEREKTKPAAPVLLCLDEFPALGYMKQLETAAGLIASFSVKLHIVVQDLTQLQAEYGKKWETFVGNAGIVQAFGNTDLTTLEYLSKRLGKTQVEVTRTSEVNKDRRNEGLSGRSSSMELHDLLTPDEISRQFSRHDPLKRQLILWAGRHPMMMQRVIWHSNDGPLRAYVTTANIDANRRC